jgi:putative ABC transport system ATP-binding protein
MMVETVQGFDGGSARSEVIIELRGATKVYSTGAVPVYALRGVDLQIREGEIVVILGPSGSGKSTLLNMLGGLDLPSEGDFRYRSVDMSKAGEKALTQFRRERVGFVFQFYNLIPSLTARENVAVATDIASNPMRPEEALEWVGLGQRMEHFPSQMSGGEQQRVAIARALAKRPDLLLCDEPTGALDVKMSRVVLQIIARTNREFGTTTVIITHNPAIAALANRVISVVDGRVASERTQQAASVDQVVL